jgi:antitoxin MazE
MRARIVKIGNSQGIRIPKPILEQSGITEEVDILKWKTIRLSFGRLIQPQNGMGYGISKRWPRRATTDFSMVNRPCDSWDETEWQW